MTLLVYKTYTYVVLIISIEFIFFKGICHFKVYIYDNVS